MTALIDLGWLLFAFLMAGLVWRVSARWLAVIEQIHTRPVVKPLEAMPPDLIMRASQESTPWAKEDYMKRLYELYAASGEDWDKVRHMLLLEDVNT